MLAWLALAELLWMRPLAAVRLQTRGSTLPSADALLSLQEAHLARLLRAGQYARAARMIGTFLRDWRLAGQEAAGGARRPALRLRC